MTVALSISPATNIEVTFIGDSGYYDVVTIDSNGNLSKEKINKDYYSITFEALEGTIFDSSKNHGMYSDGSWERFTVSSDGKTLSTNSSVSLMTSYATLSVYTKIDNTIPPTVEPEEPIPIIHNISMVDGAKFTKGTNLEFTFTNENGTSFIHTVNENGDFDNNEVIEGTYAITVKPLKGRINEGYFYDAGTLFNFIVNDDGTLATLENYSVAWDIEFYFHIVAEPAPTKSLGFNNVYVGDYEMLKDIAEERFTVASVGENRIDLAQYIINVIELPFIIPEEMKGNNVEINLAGYYLKTMATEVINDYITIPLGSITVNGSHGNVFDFINTKTLLHLPFSKTNELDIDYVINQTINIEYVVNLYTGDGTVNVYSSKTNRIVVSETFKLGRVIPFATLSGGRIGENESNVEIYNNIRTPFIEVIRNNPYSELMNETTSIKKDILQNYSGFVKMTDIKLNSEATLNERSRIISLLEGGIYINEN